jgi:hypothetical protein
MIPPGAKVFTTISHIGQQALEHIGLKFLSF